MQRDTSAIMLLLLLLIVSFVFQPAPTIVEKERIVYVEKPLYITPSGSLPLLTFEATAYTAGRESTGKSPSHRLYGVTASGNMVRESHTLACPRSLPLGTRIYIIETDTLYTCEDRGGAIVEGKLDIFMASLRAAEQWGRRTVHAYVMPNAVR
jgi:3D (Asp-Asp-Asp) domain-containing protein